MGGQEVLITCLLEMFEFHSFSNRALHCEKESTEVRLFCFLIQLVGIQMPDNCISIKGAYTLVLKYYLIALQYQQMVFKTIPSLRYEIVVPLIHIVGIKSVLWRRNWYLQSVSCLF